MAADLLSLMALFFCMLSVLVSVYLLWRCYRKYLHRMETDHMPEWEKLMERDPLIDAAGDWVRWPVGSIYLYLSIFNKTETYDDDEIKRFKRNAVRYSLALLLSIFALAVAVYATR